MKTALNTIPRHITFIKGCKFCTQMQKGKKINHRYPSKRPGGLHSTDRKTNLKTTLRSKDRKSNLKILYQICSFLSSAERKKDMKNKTNKNRTKVKLSQVDIYVLTDGLRHIKDLCEAECPTSLLWSRDYVDDLMHRLSVHLDDFTDERE